MPSDLPPPPRPRTIRDPVVPLKNHPFLGDNFLSACHPYCTPELETQNPGLYQEIQNRRRHVAELFPDVAIKLNAIRERIKAVTGVSHMRELNGRSSDPDLVARMDDDILRHWTVFGGSLNGEGVLPQESALLKRLLQDDLHQRRQAMMRWGRAADYLIDDIVHQFYPDRKTSISLNNEVGGCHSRGQLRLWVADKTGVTPPLSSQARRKDELMQLFATADMILNRKSHHIPQFNLFMQQLMYPEGKRVGETLPAYVIAQHDPNQSFVCKGARFHIGPEDPDLSPAHGQNLVTIPEHYELREIREHYELREIRLNGGGDVVSTVPCLVHTREKKAKNAVLKSIRKDSTLEDLDDWIGIRLIFDRPEYVKLFKTTFAERLERAGHRISFKETQNGAGSQRLPMDKYNLIVDGELDYEVQAFTLEQFADYQRKTPYAWALYELERFFATPLPEALLPRAIHGVDHEEAYQRALARVTRDLMNGPL